MRTSRMIERVLHGQSPEKVLNELLNEEKYVLVRVSSAGDPSGYFFRQTATGFEWVPSVKDATLFPTSDEAYKTRAKYGFMRVNVQPVKLGGLIV